MEFGMRFARASALTATVAMATIVGTASADLRPPVADGSTAKVGKAAALAALPAEPTFINGLAQPVFATAEADWVNYELWVQSNFDSDGDGKNDRIHVDVSRPKETDTDGLKVPVIFEDSPYYAGGANAANWNVEHELGQPPAARIRDEGYFPTAGRTSPKITGAYEAYWVPRGYAVVHAESPGSGHSDGCTTSGAPNETQGAVAVIDWLNGRAKGYTTRDGMDEIAPASWHNGKTAMMGTSYNGTIPIAAATTGVEGLAAIVPVAAISDWYDYYRSFGLVRAPHSAQGGQNGNNGYLGEDLDVLTEYTYSRIRDTNPRTVCKPVLDQLRDTQDRLTGNRSAVWDSRNYMKDADKIKAATLLVHGGNDFNVMTKNAAQLWDVLKRNNVARQFYFHQALMGPSGSGKTTLLNLVGGLDRPNEGAIEAAGDRIDRMPGRHLARWRSEKIGFVFQLYNLLPMLTAERNVELPLLLTRLTSAERRRRVGVALSLVGLADRAKHYPRQLSGGQEQRVGIARAIVTDPMLLLCDEPTGDLDRRSGDEILELLRVLNRDHGKTIVMVTHDPHAAACAQRVLHLEKGQLTAEVAA
jgi:ABC-type lipoprotein export system ATPase subunit